MGKHVRNRRQLRRIGLTALAVVLGVGVWQGVAGATATSKTEKIQHNNANCGRSIGTPQIGTADFSRNGNTVSVDVNLTSADPDRVFTVQLWMPKAGGHCKLVGGIGEIETDDAGMGHGKYSSPVDPKSHEFFVDLLMGGCVKAPKPLANCLPDGAKVAPVDNDSLIANL